MEQHWHNLLLAHWPVPVEVLRPLVPPNLPIDTFEGQAWLGVIAFQLKGIRLRGFPPIPFTSAFPEINLRTYVTVEDKPGVYFITMDADNGLGTVMARRWFRLPYTQAQIHLKIEGERIDFSSRRTERGMNTGSPQGRALPKKPQAEFAGSYRPVSEVDIPQPGSIDHWLAERYCYYRANERNVYRCQVHHMPWPLQKAEADIEKNTLASSLGVDLPSTQPLLRYAHHMKALIWPVRRVTSETVSEEAPLLPSGLSASTLDEMSKAQVETANL
jgi:uncharacterized protein YqjF (DUF2071 family)